MKSILIIFGSVLLFFGCSATEESTKNLANEVYIFDDTSVNKPEKADISTSQIQQSESQTQNVKSEYIVQIAAFSTEERADIFIEESQKLLKYHLLKKYIEKSQLFVVQIPAFKTRSEAEAARNELWKSEKFKDAFIVP